MIPPTRSESHRRIAASGFNPITVYSAAGKMATAKLEAILDESLCKVNSSDVMRGE